MADWSGVVFSLMTVSTLSCGRDSSAVKSVLLGDAGEIFAAGAGWVLGMSAS
jgi:hypothetical protein